LNAGINALHAFGMQKKRAGIVNIWTEATVLYLRAHGRDSFIANLLVRIHSIIELILADRPCTIVVCIPFSK
jgi:hypothetical protein